MSDKRLNPFQSFILKTTTKPEIDQSSNGNSIKAPSSIPDSSLPVNQSASSNANGSVEDNGEIWVHYIDDETGFPYMFNTLTGEARWLTESEYQSNDQAVVIVESPWETMYDNEGNMYYYNKETGVSAWEIPAEDLMKYGLATLQNQDTGYYQDIGLDPTVSDQLTSGLGSMNLLEEALGESIGDSSIEGSKNILYKNNSMKSIRSARSFGLKSPIKGEGLESLAKQISSQVESTKSAMATPTSLKKGGKTQLSFVLNNKKSFRVDDSLKPTTPSVKKSKNGFEILKVLSSVLRSGMDEFGEIWLEYQSADDGPLFYARKGVEGGQWRIPATFNSIDLENSQELDVAPAFNFKKDDATITPSETSLEVVDFFSVDKDEVLKIQSPSLKKSDPASSVKSEGKQEIILSNVNLPSDNKALKSLPDSQPSKLAAHPVTMFPMLVSSEHEIKEVNTAKKTEAPSSLQSLALPVQSIVQIPSSNVELKIQSIKAEAALELEKLRKQLEIAKQSAQIGTATNLILPNELSSTSLSSRIDAPLEFSSVSATTPVPAPVNQSANLTESTGLKLEKLVNTIENTFASNQYVAIVNRAVALPNELPSSQTSSANAVSILPSQSTLSIEDPNKDSHPKANKKLHSSSITTTGHLTLQNPTSELVSPPIVSATPKTFAAASTPPMSVPKGVNGEILWDEIVPRSILLRSTLRWECFFDAQTKFKFYKRRSDGFLQVDKPYDFDTFNLSSRSLLGLATNEAAGGLSTTEAPISKDFHQPTANHVSFVEDVLSAKSASPSVKKKKSKKSNSSRDISSFLTGVDLVQPDQELDEEEKMENANDISLQKSIQEVIPTEVEEDVLQQMLRELAFVERHSSRAIRAVYQERAHLEQQDADKLSSRLQSLAEKRLRMEESKRMRLTDRYVAGMDTDQLRRLQARSKQLLERCYEVQEYIEISPVEHAMIEMQVLRSAILQREHLSFPLDMKHDQPLYHFAPPEALFASSRVVTDYWIQHFQPIEKTGWLRLRHYSKLAEFGVFFHSHRNLVQNGEPFDIAFRKEAAGMKKENWGDYEVKVSISQSVLENAGIELWEESNGGYVFYCPIRCSYSSNGRFDPISFDPTTGRPSSIRRQVAAEESWQKRLKPTIWKQLGLKNEEASNNAQQYFMTTGMLQDATNMEKPIPGALSPETSNFRMAKSDSADNFHISKNSQMISSMNSLRESARKNSNYFHDILQSLDAIREKSKAISPNTVDHSKGTIKLNVASVLEEAFSIAHQSCDPSTIMATNEEILKFEAGNSNSFGQQFADEIVSDAVDLSSEVAIESLKYENRFDEETMQKYQQLLIFSYQDPENPYHLFALMEFLLHQGLNKSALAVLKRAISVMQSHESYKPSKYEQALIQMMRSKLSTKCSSQFTGYEELLKLLNYFPDRPLILSFAGSYFTRIHHFDWAQVSLLGALMVSPSYELALVKLAHLLFLQGDLKQSSRYLQKTAQENENGLWSRQSKLESAWILEMLGADDEALIVGYKALIGATSRDVVQAKTLLSLGNLFQRLRKFRLTFEYYQRALQMDRDLGTTSALFATAQSIQFVQNQVIPTSIPTACAENGGSYDTASDTKIVDEMMQQSSQPAASSGKVSNRPPSAAAAHRSTTPNKMNRPKSAGAIRARPSGTSKSQPLLSSSHAVFPLMSNPLTSTGAASTQAPAFSESFPISLLAQTPAKNKTAATISVSDNTSKPLVSAQQNMTWKHSADALYRRGLILVPDTSYHWISLLAYADFIMATMKDTKRALEYYEDAVKESFSTQIWTIIALGTAYQYVTNDLAAARRLYTRALWSRHPSTPASLLSPSQRPSTQSPEKAESQSSSRKCVLSTFRGLLQRKIKGEQGVLNSSSRISSTSVQGRHTSMHFYGSHNESLEADDQEDDWKTDADESPTSRNEHLKLLREEAMLLLQSVTLSRVSDRGNIDTQQSSTSQYPQTASSASQANSSSSFQRRMLDTSNMVQQEKDCQVLYIAIAYLLWDMHEAEAAYRYALAALKLQPNYAPALRCLGYLLYYIHEDRRLAYRYFSAAIESSFSSTSMLESSAATTSISTATTNGNIALCHNLPALQTIAIVGAMRCQYDRAIAYMERVLIQSTTSRFAHRCLAVWYYQIKNYPEKALQHLHSAWELSGHGDLDVLRWKAHILMDAQAFKEARVCLLECLRIAPYDGICFANLAICVYFLCRDNHGEYVAQYEELRYGNMMKQKASNNDTYQTSHSTKMYSFEELESIAHSKDIFQLFEVAKVISAHSFKNSLAAFHEQRNRACRRKPQSNMISDSQDRSNERSKENNNQSYCHFLGGPTKGVTAAYHEDRSEESPSIDEPLFSDPHLDGRDRSTSLSYVHYLQGCLDMLMAPSLADFGIDEEDEAEDARKSALALAKTSFSMAALYAQGCDETSHHLYPLSLYHLGQIAEEEIDLVTAERLYLEAVGAKNILPVAFSQLLDCVAKNLKLHKDRLKELKRPYTKKGNDKSAGKKGISSLVEATFSDFQADSKQLNASKGSGSGGKKQGTNGTAKARKDEGLEWMLRQSAQGRGLLDPNMAYLVKSVAESKKAPFSTQESIGVGNNSEPLKDGSERAENNGDEMDESSEEEDEEENEPENRALLENVPLAVQNRTMERCFKRVMMHTRVQEAILLKKYQIGKQLKDVRASYPKLSTFAAASTVQLKNRKKRKSKKSTQQVQLQMGIPMGSLDMIKSFFYVDHDWLDRCLYSTAKCEDWATLMQCYYK